MSKNAKLTLNQLRGCWVNFKPLSPTFRTWKIFPTVTWIESNYSTKPSHPSSHSHFISFSAMQMLSLFGLGDVSWRCSSSQCGNTTISWRQAQIDPARISASQIVAKSWHFAPFLCFVANCKNKIKWRLLQSPPSLLLFLLSQPMLCLGKVLGVRSYSLECQGTPWQTNTAHVPRI